MAAKVINRYRFNSGKAYFTFFANKDELLGVEVNHSEDLKLDGVFLTKSNPKIDEAIDQVDEFLAGNRDKIELKFANDEKKFNKKIQDALK